MIVIDGEPDEIRFLVSALGAGAYRRYHRSDHVSSYGAAPIAARTPSRPRRRQANNPRSMLCVAAFDCVTTHSRAIPVLWWSCCARYAV